MQNVWDTDATETRPVNKNTCRKFRNLREWLPKSNKIRIWKRRELESQLSKGINHKRKVRKLFDLVWIPGLSSPYDPQTTTALHEFLAEQGAVVG